MSDLTTETGDFAGQRKPPKKSNERKEKGGRSGTGGRVSCREETFTCRDRGERKKRKYVSKGKERARWKGKGKEASNER